MHEKEISPEEAAKQLINRGIIDLLQYGLIMFPILMYGHCSLYVVTNPSELIDPSRGGDHSAYPG